MYVVVEAWTPKQEFLNLSATQQREIFAGAKEGIKRLAEVGVQSTGWGRLRDVEHGSPHQWLAIWSMPTEEHSDIMLSAVAASGWYDWFDQTNFRAELVSPDVAMAHHLEAF